jgi:hypothetical protein
MVETLIVVGWQIALGVCVAQAVRADQADKPRQMDSGTLDGALHCSSLGIWWVCALADTML